MKSYQEFLNESKDNSSNKADCVLDIVDALKKIFDKYTLNTRTDVWHDLSTPKGKELISKILKNPKSYLSDSEFKKLVTKKENYGK